MGSGDTEVAVTGTGAAVTGPRSNTTSRAEPSGAGRPPVPACTDPPHVSRASRTSAPGGMARVAVEELKVPASASTSIHTICWADLSTWPGGAFAGASRASTHELAAAGSQVSTALPSSTRSARSTNRSLTPAGCGWTVITSGVPAIGGPEPSEIVGMRVTVEPAATSRVSWMRPSLLAPAASTGRTHCSTAAATEQLHSGLSTAPNPTPGGSGIVTMGGPVVCRSTASASAGGAARPGPRDTAPPDPALPAVIGMVTPRPA